MLSRTKGQKSFRGDEKRERRSAFWTRKGSAAAVLIDRMTNWQRHQWAKAGFPKKEKEILTFLGMDRKEQKQNVHA
jgi:hypothetical protein